MSDGDRRPPTPPSASEVLSKVVPAERPPSGANRSEQRYIEGFRSASVQSQISYAHLTGIRDHYKHKGRWSYFLMAAIAAMLAFQSLLLVNVGLNVWNFQEYEWLLPALLVQNLAQVVGLAIWAVKYLFSDISRQDG